MKYVLIVVLFCGTAVAGEAKKEKLDLHPVEKSLLDSVNAERARYGLPPYEICPNLQRMARAHCIWMCQSYSMTHSSMGVAENIAMGQPDPISVTQCWMNSSGHRGNILNGGHRYIGLCGYQAENGQVFWCQQFSGHPLVSAIAHAVGAVATPFRHRGRR